MSREIHGAPIVRCLLVWLFTTTVTAAVLLALSPELAAAPSLSDAMADPALRSAVRFDELLAAGSALALACCALWFWTVTSVVALRAATGRLRSVRGCPDGVRRLLLAACGLALVAGATVSPAVADSTAGRPPAATDSEVISGLPLPDRPAASPPVSHPTAEVLRAPQISEVHRVRAGDTLWEIAAESLPGAASNAGIDQRWRGIWAANRKAIGPDPDLIQPGTILHLPPTKES